MAYLNEDGLARYDALLKNWVTFKSGTVDGIDPLLNWQKTSTAGAVTFYPLPAAPIDPVVNFLFTETGPAEGEKGPDNPSTITGVSSVKVTRCGKNLLTRNPISSVMSQRGITVTYNGDGSIHLKGTATSGYDAYMTYFSDTRLGVVPAVMAAGKIFTVSITCSDNNVSGKIYDSNSLTVWGTPVNVSPGTPVTHTMQSNVKSAMFRIMVTRGSTVDCDVRCQIEYGSTATAWEAPADADYTVNLGGTYYGGSVDLSAGTMTVTHVKCIADGTNIYAQSSVGNVGSNYRHAINVVNVGLPAPKIGDYINSSSTHFSCIAGLFDSFGVFSQASQYIIIPDVNGVHQTNQSFNDWLKAQNAAGTPVEFVYTVATPYTIQLTPTQIYSLSQPDPYTPRINTVYSDQTSVQVGYPKSPQATAAELTNAIISLGSNL